MNRTNILVTGLVVGALIVSGAMFGLASTGVAARVQDSPAESSVNAPPATFSAVQLDDAWRAADALQAAAGDIGNAVRWLLKGSIEGVELNDAQKQAVKEVGYGGLVRGVGRYQDLLTLLGVTQAQLTTWEATHPQPEPCYESLANCSTPTP